MDLVPTYCEVLKCQEDMYLEREYGGLVFIVFFIFVNFIYFNLIANNIRLSWIFYVYDNESLLLILWSWAPGFRIFKSIRIC